MIRRQALGEPGHDAAEARREEGTPLLDVGRQAEFARRHEGHRLERPDAALVGRVERAERLDLVAEPFQAHGQWLAGREAVDDAAAPRDLPSAGDLGHGLVAEVHHMTQQPLLGDARPRSDDERLTLEVGDRQGPLDERLDARHEDAGAAGMPGRERSDASRRLVTDELRALVCERRPSLERDDRRRASPGGQLFRHAIGDLGVTGDPDQPFAGGDREGRRQERLGAVRHGAIRHVAPIATDAASRRAQTRGEGLKLSRGRQQRGQDGEVSRAAPLAGRR